MNQQTINTILGAIDADNAASTGRRCIKLTVLYDDGNAEDLTPMPKPPPPPAPGPTMTHVVQSDSAYYRTQTTGDMTIENIVISQGGLIHSIGGRNLTIRNCYSEGAPGQLGVYFVLVATGPGRVLLWDNSGVKDRWICSGPDSGCRIMGDCQSAMIIGVDFVTRMHDLSDGGTGSKLSPIPQLHPLKQPKPPPGAKWDQWKQNPQVRDVRKANFKACRFVGLVDIGKQANPGSPQKVDDLTFDSCGFEHLPHFTDPKSYGTVRMINCRKLDHEGNDVTDAHGVVKWPDHTWHGH